YEGDTALCSLIQRNAQGDPTVLTLPSLNLNQMSTKGADIEADYSTPLPGMIWDVTFRALATYVDHLIVTNEGESEELAGIVGTGYGGLPHWRSNVNATFSGGPWVVYAEERFIEGGQYTNLFTVNDNRISEEFL